MSNIIFKTDGKETSRMPSRTIQELTIGTKTPETKLEIKMTETDISKVLIEGEYATIMGIRYKRVEEPKTSVEEAYKRVYNYYPPTTPSVSNFEDTRWRAFELGYRAAQEDGVVEEPSKPMNEVLDRLENKYKQAEENAASYMTDEVVDRMLKKWEENPPEFLKFELGKTLEALITRWWCDVFGGTNQDWDMETAIDDLCDQIELWLPKSQSHEGTQDVSVIDLVDGYNDALTKIKSKLRNKK
jgi:hypothetical protein